jgi:signal transduction histidine kinase
VDAGWVSLRRQGEPLAAIRLSRSDRDAAEVEELVGSAARLAIDNERLQAELRAQLAELRASRQRIVLAADDTRRVVERSIHDVVQAELIGALFELADSGTADGPVAPGAAASDSRLAGRVRDLVRVLREFSRGAYPAVLDASGLGPALEALTYETPVAVTVDCRLDHRPPAEVEHAAYALVHDWAMRAEHNLTVDVTATRNAVVVQIVGDAGEVSEELADRVGALGGMVTVEDGRLRAVLPCA